MIFIVKIALRLSFYSKEIILEVLFHLLFLLGFFLDFEDHTKQSFFFALIQIRVLVMF